MHFAFTGFIGYTLGPVLSAHLALPGGAQSIALALGATGTTLLALSGWVLATRRDLSFMGGFLFAGMVIALVAGVAAMFFQIPALGLAVSAMVALLSAGLILFETSRIVNGGETNYVLATVSPFVFVRIAPGLNRRWHGPPTYAVTADLRSSSRRTGTGVASPVATCQSGNSRNH
ncbi:Bax inhibitor-1 family protein [Acidovorax sp. SRB_24]|uniref:Bax inhibitor-1 family protein n=1 Tax=Acidovorax sp. SRB_24 TaxID=1962700 RepID=UPI0035301143